MSSTKLIVFVTFFTTVTHHDKLSELRIMQKHVMRKKLHNVFTLKKERRQNLQFQRDHQRSMKSQTLGSSPLFSPSLSSWVQE